MPSLLTYAARYLKTRSEITTLTENRIYSTHLPQSFDWKGLAISMNHISGQTYPNLRNSTGVATSRLQIDVWGLHEDQCEILTEALRTVFDSFTGSMAGLTVLATILDNVVCLPEEPTDGSNQWRFHYASDYLVTYRNTVAPIRVCGSAFSSAFSSAFGSSCQSGGSAFNNAFSSAFG